MEGENAGGYVMFDLLAWGNTDTDGHGHGHGHGNGTGNIGAGEGSCGGGASIREWSYSRRIEKLRAVLVSAGLIEQAGATAAQTVSEVQGLALLIPATEPQKKQAVMSGVMQAGGEGIIVRTLDAPSLQGDTRHERKLKFVADVDAIVIGIKPGVDASPGSGSLRLGLVRPEDGAIIEVGCVRSGLRDADIAHIGTLLLEQGRDKAHVLSTPPTPPSLPILPLPPVMTVSFLKARTVGITLVEPTTAITRLRTDKHAIECTTDQLVEVLGEDRVAMISNARPILSSSVPPLLSPLPRHSAASARRLTEDEDSAASQAAA